MMDDNKNKDTLDMMRPIYGSHNIGKYLGYSGLWVRRRSKEMKEMGVLWHKSKKKTSALVSTPYFLSIYFIELQKYREENPRDYSKTKKSLENIAPLNWRKSGMVKGGKQAV